MRLLYKELAEELFCRYAGYPDYAAGGTVLNHIIAASFEKQ